MHSPSIERFESSSTSATPSPATPLPHDALAAAAGALARGLLVFDTDARVLAHNSAALHLLATRVALGLEAIRGLPGAMRLSGRDTALLSSVEQGVHDLVSDRPAASGRADTPRPTRALLLRADPGDAALVLHLCALPRAARTGAETDHAVLGTLVDLARRPRIDSRRLCELFDLSVASARVAEAYLRVDSVKDAARLLGISANTVKTHLATVYERTGCTRQSQLVRLLMALAEGDSV
jgi:DNA-binding CsgD family transcriptional regulator